MQALTPRQAEVWTFLQSYIAEHGFSPTYREISAHFDLSSANAAVCHILAMEKKGWLKRTAKTSRSFVLLKLADRKLVPHG